VQRALAAGYAVLSAIAVGFAELWLRLLKNRK
jgi:hypothetical protein